MLVFAVLFSLTGCGDSGSTAEESALEVLDTYESEEEGDRLVLEQLRAGGADLTKETDLRWFLYFPARAPAEALAGKVRAAGWEVVVEPVPDSDQWLTLCSRDAVPSLETIEAMRRSFEEWTEGVEADLDGWEAAITR